MIAKKCNIQFQGKPPETYVIKVERACTIGYLLDDCSKGITLPSACVLYGSVRIAVPDSSAPIAAAHLDGFEGKRFPSKTELEVGIVQIRAPDFGRHDVGPAGGSGS